MRPHGCLPMLKSSLHGGHSGQFCDHARDSLAEMVATYHAQGFECVGLAEHMPPPADAWLYPDEVALGRSASWMQTRFAAYVREARRLAEEYAGRMRIFVGMESEWYPGCESWVRRLRADHGLDYVVGSVHHVRGVCFDYSRDTYAQAVAACGGLAALYADYFDAHLEMLHGVEPEVVGHFDLIRLYDPNYRDTLAVGEVWARVVRNLDWARDHGAVLDFNARALLKGQAEPYVCAPILNEAGRVGIKAAYGDDAHGCADVGHGWEVCAQALYQRGMALAEFAPAVLSGGDPEA